jgi:hypothetical protein
MNKKEREKLESIYKDCVQLEKTYNLTEYGAGRGDLCKNLLKKKRKLFKSFK